MRTIIDIPNEWIEQIHVITQRNKTSRAAIIREALAQYLQKQIALDCEEAFGIWQDELVEALHYEQTIRAEWGP